MADLKSILESIFGPANPVVTPAPALTQYPTVEDAQFAQQSGFGYGTANEPYIQNQAARVMGTTTPGYKKDPATFTPHSASGMTTGQATGAVDDGNSANIDLSREDRLRKILMDYYARAALASNRDPIASLGFDPRRAAVDTEMERSNIGGAYSPSKDSMYAAASDPSAIVHESIHRGLQKLRQDPEMAAEIKKIPEEMIVRFLMAKAMGDPEREGGSIDKRERGDALRMIDQSITGKPQTIQKLEQAAQKMIAKQQPMGPR